MRDVFNEVAAQNLSFCEGVELELAFMVSSGGPDRGLGIEIRNQQAPIFISVSQLRDMADLLESA